MSRSPAPGRGKKRQPFDFQTLIENQQVGKRTDDLSLMEAMCKEDYIAWYTEKCPMFKRALALLGV